MAKSGVEGAVLSALSELSKVFGESRVLGAAGQLLQTAARTKAAVDDNVAAVLGLAGLPSRNDVDQLRRQLDVVQATLANLSRKLDRLAAEVAAHQPEHSAPARRKPHRPTKDD